MPSSFSPLWLFPIVTSTLLMPVFVLICSGSSVIDIHEFFCTKSARILLQHYTEEGAVSQQKSSVSPFYTGFKCMHPCWCPKVNNHRSIGLEETLSAWTLGGCAMAITNPSVPSPGLLPSLPARYWWAEKLEGRPGGNTRASCMRWVLRSSPLPPADFLLRGHCTAAPQWGWQLRPFGIWHGICFTNYNIICCCTMVVTSVPHANVLWMSWKTKYHK